MNSNIPGYIIRQLASANAWADGFTRDSMGRSRYARYAFVKLNKFCDDFMADVSNKRWIIMPGLRGVGKTTLMAQQYSYVRASYGDRAYMIHMSMQDVVHVMKGTLIEALDAYETQIGRSFEQLDKPVFLFIDEVQEDEQWGAVLQALHDRSPKIFIVCSGSSATHLQTNTDISRRAFIECIYPLNYTEYQMLRNNVTPVKGLKTKLKEAAFESKDAESAYKALVKLTPFVRNYLSKIDTKNFSHYMYTGSLPFLINETNQAQAYAAINSLIDHLISEDLAQVYSLDGSTLASVKPLLYLLAEGDVVSKANIASTLGMDVRMVGTLLDALVKAELLIAVTPHGTASSAMNKATKYLFMSPAIRSSFYQISGVSGTDETRKGQLLEDLVGLFMQREYITRHLGSLTYKTGKGEADYLLQTVMQRRLAIEVGKGTKGSKQVEKTMSSIKCDYGIVLSSHELHIDKDRNILYLPLTYFYLM